MKTNISLRFLKNRVSKILYVIAIAAVAVSCSKDDEKGDDTYVNIPDPVFSAYCLEFFDYNKDGKISESEALKIEQINCTRNYSDADDTKIKTLTGIEKMTNLEILYVEYNLISSINLSGNPHLEELFMDGNPLNSIDVSANTDLDFLQLSRTNIKSLDVSKNLKLDVLYLEESQLSSIDISKLTGLEAFDVSSTNVTKIDVSKNTELEYLYVSDINLTELDVTKNPDLLTLSCELDKLTTLDISKNRDLKQLYADGMPTLKTLYVYSGQTAKLTDCFLDEGVEVIVK